MHPGAFLPTLVHDNGVCLIPLVLACPPQGRQRRRKLSGRLSLGERAFEFGQRDCSIGRSACKRLISFQHSQSSRSRDQRIACADVRWPPDASAGSRGGIRAERMMQSRVPAACPPTAVRALAARKNQRSGGICGSFCLRNQDQLRRDRRRRSAVVLTSTTDCFRCRGNWLFVRDPDCRARIEQ